MKRKRREGGKRGREGEKGPRVVRNNWIDRERTRLKTARISVNKEREGERRKGNERNGLGVGVITWESTGDASSETSRATERPARGSRREERRMARRWTEWDVIARPWP